MSIHNIKDELASTAADFGTSGQAFYSPELGAHLIRFGDTAAPSTYPTSAVADTRFLNLYFKSTATTGTSRGLYLRQYLTAGAGGEALRVFNTCSSDTPADTVNGAHISQSFGSTAGNVTGQATAVRATFHVPSRTLGGTIDVVKAEAWSDGVSSTGDNIAFFAAENAGDATGKAAMAIKTHLFRIVSAAGNGSMVDAGATLGTAYGGLRVLVNGTVRYIPLYTDAPS